MQRKRQITILDWLDDYIKEISRVYGTGYSENIAFILCYGYARAIHRLHPELDISIDIGELTDNEKNYKDDGSIETDRKVKSDLFYETRRMIEYRMKYLKKMKTASKKVR